MFFDACGYDAFCGLSELCCCGRPDWFDVFSEASKKNDAKHKFSKGEYRLAQAFVHSYFDFCFVMSNFPFSCVSLPIFGTDPCIFACRGGRFLLRAPVDGKRPRNQHREVKQQQQVQDALQSHGRKILN
jgi:hypothetical protein